MSIWPKQEKGADAKWVNAINTRKEKEKESNRADIEEVIVMLYNCRKEVLIPPPKFIKCNCSEDYKETVGVDACLSEEIKELWEQGIKTTGCCCGHGRSLGFIEVTDECISEMEKLGYQHYIYADEFGGIERKDAFIPKSYGHEYDGYSEYYRG